MNVFPFKSFETSRKLFQSFIFISIFDCFICFRNIIAICALLYVKRKNKYAVGNKITYMHMYRQYLYTWYCIRSLRIHIRIRIQHSIVMFRRNVNNITSRAYVYVCIVAESLCFTSSFTLYMLCSCVCMLY